MAAAAGAVRAGEIRCWVDRGAVVVPAAYGPVAGDFILDLSQARSQMNVTAARTAGWTEQTTRWTLRLAGGRRPGFPMMVSDLDARTLGMPTNIAGVLGADAIGAFTVDLDLEPCRLRLTRGSRRIEGGRLKTRIIGGVPAVFAAVSDGFAARAGWFAIDTASLGSRIADAGFSRPLPNGVDPSDRARPPGRLRAISLAGALVEQTPAGLMSPVTPGLAGALGVAVWSRVHLHLAPAGR
jgi:hypothetical protein